MREKALKLLGLMRRAGAVAVGETNTCITVRDGKAKLLLVASDASANAQKRAESLLNGRRLTAVQAPFTKDELSGALGLPGCSMAAVSDIGFANAFMELLRELDGEKYSSAAEEIRLKFSKAQKRRAEAKTHERNKRIGKRRTKA